MFKLINKDKRGRIWLCEFMGKEYLLLETKAGFYRGGDFHQTIQTDVVLHGTIRWFEDDGVFSHGRYMIEGDININPALIPHMMFSITDSLILEWLEKPQQKKTYYKPFRDIVNRMNERNAKR